MGEISLTVTFDPSTGRIGLNAPMDQRMMCYGMLEMAKEILLKHGAQQTGSKLITPPVGLRLS